MDDGVFFAGDSAGHCIPLTAEGIRTALYFGLACGRELREVVEGRQTHAQALSRYGAFSDSHEWKFRWMLRMQDLVPKIPPRLLQKKIGVLGMRGLTHWAFSHYKEIAHHRLVQAGPPPRARRPAPQRVAA